MYPQPNRNAHLPGTLHLKPGSWARFSQTMDRLAQTLAWQSWMLAMRIYSGSGKGEAATFVRLWRNRPLKRKRESRTFCRTVLKIDFRDWPSVCRFLLFLFGKMRGREFFLEEMCFELWCFDRGACDEMWKYAVYFADYFADFVICCEFQWWHTIRWDFLIMIFDKKMLLEKFAAMHRARWASYLEKKTSFTQ
jgi:hypothetical protein